MVRTAVVCLVLAGMCGLAAAKPCRFDRSRYGTLAGTGGFGEALVCGKTRLDDVWVRVAADGSITALHWSEYQGANLKRTIQVYDSGKLTFIVEDRSVKGGFFAQTRGASHFMFPRGGAMSVEQGRDGRLNVYDSAGHVWHLVGAPVEGAGPARVSYLVASIDLVKQPTTPISFAKQGIVSVDVPATRTLYLQAESTSLSGLEDKRSKQYLKTKSIFHDSQGQTCAVENDQLFVPSPADPKDRADNALRFTDDKSLATFLAQTCPKLDISGLEP